MIGTLIGAGLSAAGSIFGGMKAARERRKQADNIAKLERENQAWYDREYNTDPTIRASAAALLSKTADAVRAQNRNAAGRQAVMGGTSDSVAAAKEATSKTLSNAASSIAAQDTARKDRVDSMYRTQMNNLTSRKNNLAEQKAHDISSATQALLGTAGSIAQGLDSSDSMKKGVGSGNTIGSGNTVDSDLKKSILRKNQKDDDLFGDGESWLQKKFAGL